MTQFKRTINKKTNNTTYYVDGKRVSEGNFGIKEVICRAAGMRYNCSYTTSDNNYIRHYHSYN